ncbi:ABC transporter ATP-binding protein [Flaviflexus sp.]|uniref:ABC transporter ATP-binding protein n=1 Tax=Flaviflexus sp. TaxID=1969482 RepID=UPI003F91F465
MKSLLRIVRFTKELRVHFAVIILASVLTAVAALVIPFIIAGATDVVVEAISGDRTESSAIRTVLWLAGAFLIIELASTAVSSIGGYVGDVMSARMRSILSVRYFEKLLSLPQRYFDNELTGTIVSRLNRSITEVTNFAKMFSNSFFTMIITTVAVLVITAWYAWPLALLLAIIFPVYMWLTTLTSKKWQKYEGKKNEDIDVAGGRFNEVVGQIKVVKSFVSELRELKSFTKRYDRTIQTTRKQSQHWHGMDALRRGIMAVIFFGIYAIIFTYTVQGRFSVGDMVLLVQLVAMARQPVGSMSFLVDSAQHAIAGSRDYFEVMEIEVDRAPTLAEQKKRAETSASSTAIGPAARSGSAIDGAALTPAQDDLAATLVHDGPAVAFEDVTFGYDDDPDVLKGVSFSVRTGEKIAIVGESGGGKTTIISLLLGLYRLRGGTIAVAGTDVHSLSLLELRSQIGVVFQDSSLFSGTIRENIGYANEAASEAEIIEAAKKANAWRFIEDFPNGLDTVIGERGLKLSGGQKQRISVARAILKDPSILVLDEATSALDTRSERLVQEGLETLMENRTSLIIAHRLSTISSVDRIVTLRDGVVEEIGSPAELAVSGGIYAELLALQEEGTKRAKKAMRSYGIER